MNLIIYKSIVLILFHILCSVESVWNFDKNVITLDPIINKINEDFIERRNNLSLVKTILIIKLA